MKEVDTLPPVKVPKFEDAFPNFVSCKKLIVPKMLNHKLY